VCFFDLRSPREEEDEEAQEELGGFQLLTDDNAFDSEEVWTDGAKQLLQHSKRTPFIYLVFEYSHQCKVSWLPEQATEMF